MLFKYFFGCNDLGLELVMLEFFFNVMKVPEDHRLDFLIFISMDQNNKKLILMCILKLIYQIFYLKLVVLLGLMFQFLCDFSFI